MLRKFSTLTLITCFVSAAALAADPPWIARSQLGMVASDSPEASQIGADVLTAGGNAFDAAIATSFALGVSRPQSTGLGGGGFMVGWLAKEKHWFALDFREMAPKAATAERYFKLNAARGDGPSPSIYGGNAVGVPGQLAGLAEIQKRYATRSLKDLVQPALKLAETGFSADESYRGACREALAEFQKWPQFKQQYARLYETLLANGTPPKVGEKVKRSDLAEALELIARDGAAAFYKGPIGQAAIKAVEAVRGCLTAEDLANYRVRVREPLQARYSDFLIATMPPPSSGGVCIVETLNILSATRFRSDLHPTGDRPHVLVEALKHAFADRARWLGDPDFASLPLRRLLSPAYGSELSRRIAYRRTLPSEQYGSAAIPTGDGGTSHFCVADKDGNVVALTETINGVFGSFLIAEPYGIILNNQMDDFTTDPGKPNLFGLIQGQANIVAPGKRPLSSMAPTIVFKDARPVLTLGASGGPRIITSVLQVMRNVIEFEMPLDQAMEAIRIHHQWQPDEIYFDREPPAEIAATLKEVGHNLSAERKTGIVQAIQFLPDGTMVGASDPRKDGRPIAAK